MYLGELVRLIKQKSSTMFVFNVLEFLFLKIKEEIKTCKTCLFFSLFLFPSYFCYSLFSIRCSRTSTLWSEEVRPLNIYILAIQPILHKCKNSVQNVKTIPRTIVAIFACIVIIKPRHSKRNECPPQKKKKKRKKKEKYTHASLTYAFETVETFEAFFTCAQASSLITCVFTRLI